MLKLGKMAVTGGLASGKSTVCQIFQELGACVVSADEIVHKLLSPDTSIGQKVIKLIGNDIVVDQRIDRAKIAQKVFNQPQLLQSLEQLLHPAVLEEIETCYQKANSDKSIVLFIAEVPLLFEACMEPFFDAVIVVVADPRICKKRFQDASGYDEEEYAKRTANQFSMGEKAKRGDYLIKNNGNRQELRQNIVELYKLLLNTNKIRNP